MPSTSRQTPWDGHCCRGTELLAWRRGCIACPQKPLSQGCRPHCPLHILGTPHPGHRTARERHGIHPKIHPLRSGERAVSGSLLPGWPGRAAADATAAKGGRKTGKTGSGLRQRLEGPTLLLRLALGKALRFSLFRFERQEVGRAALGGRRRPYPDHASSNPGVFHPPASSATAGHHLPVLPQRCRSRGASTAGTTSHRLSPPQKCRQSRPCHPHTEPKPPGNSGWWFPGEPGRQEGTGQGDSGVTPTPCLAWVRFGWSGQDAARQDLTARGWSGGHGGMGTGGCRGTRR